MNGLTRAIEVFSRNPDDVSRMIVYLGKYEVADRFSATSNFRHGLCQPTLDPLSTFTALLSTSTPANAAPEWQARSLRRRNRDELEACSLEGPVSRQLWPLGIYRALNYLAGFP